MYQDAPDGLVRGNGDGVVLTLHVRPGARRTEVEAVDQWRHALTVAVKAPAKKGAANREVVELVARWLGVERRRVRVVKGESSHTKSIRIDGMKVEELMDRLEGLARQDTL